MQGAVWKLPFQREVVLELQGDENPLAVAPYRCEGPDKVGSRVTWRWKTR